MIENVTWGQAAASLTLVVLTIAVGWWLRLGVTRRLVVAAARAAVQLIAVGLLFGLIVESSRALVLAWMWVAIMVGVTAAVAHRRAPKLPNGSLITALAVVTTVGLCLLVVFGLGIIDYEPVNLIVIAGITIGNTLPALVLGAKQTVNAAVAERGQIEALMATGMTTMQIVQQVGGPIARLALVPQIERTNVVGLIALPGAMTGLLLAGVAPRDAVLIQLVVMYLVLGAVALSVVVTVSLGIRSLFTPALTLLPLDDLQDQGST
jgi:putative ABC transport system permease protein